MVNFGGRETVPVQWNDCLLHLHNSEVTLMRTTAEENQKYCKVYGNKNQSEYWTTHTANTQKGCIDYRHSRNALL
jgi:hypothetical protein